MRSDYPYHFDEFYAVYGDRNFSNFPKGKNHFILMNEYRYFISVLVFRMNLFLK
jgi:hypothetical protein